MLVPRVVTDHRLVPSPREFVTGRNPGIEKSGRGDKRRVRSDRRYGRGPVELIVVAAIVGFALMIVLISLPKGRELARMAKCQQNLMQIGVGLQMYHQAQSHYPTVPKLDGSLGNAPIQALFETFVVPDLLQMQDPSKPPKPSQPPARGVRVPGLTCPSDSNAVGGVSSPFINYRANTGSSADGSGGPFAPGRTTTSTSIEQADGLSYTAAFAERVVGDGKSGEPARCNYATIPGPITGSTAPPGLEEQWRGDAGSDWAEATWRSTLYTHALSPNAAQSWISNDGRSALMGASSSHVGRINVLMMDGSVKGVTPTIDAKVWDELGTIGAPRSIKE